MASIDYTAGVVGEEIPNAPYYQVSAGSAPVFAAAPGGGTMVINPSGYNLISLPERTTSVEWTAVFGTIPNTLGGSQGGDVGDPVAQGWAMATFTLDDVASADVIQYNLWVNNKTSGPDPAGLYLLASVSGEVDPWVEAGFVPTPGIHTVRVDLSDSTLIRVYFDDVLVISMVPPNPVEGPQPGADTFVIYPGWVGDPDLAFGTLSIESNDVPLPPAITAPLVEDYEGGADGEAITWENSIFPDINLYGPGSIVPAVFDSSRFHSGSKSGTVDGPGIYASLGITASNPLEQMLFEGWFYATEAAGVTSVVGMLLPGTWPISNPEVASWDIIWDPTNVGGLGAGLIASTYPSMSSGEPSSSVLLLDAASTADRWLRYEVTFDASNVGLLSLFDENDTPLASQTLTGLGTPPLWRFAQSLVQGLWADDTQVGFNVPRLWSNGLYTEPFETGAPGDTISTSNTIFDKVTGNSPAEFTTDIVHGGAQSAKTSSPTGGSGRFDLNGSNPLSDVTLGGYFYLDPAATESYWYLTSFGFDDAWPLGATRIYFDVFWDVDNTYGAGQGLVYGRFPAGGPEEYSLLAPTADVVGQWLHLEMTFADDGASGTLVIRDASNDVVATVPLTHPSLVSTQYWQMSYYADSFMRVDDVYLRVGDPPVSQIAPPTTGWYLELSDGTEAPIGLDDPAHWLDVPSLPPSGPQGDPGPTGPAGPQGPAGTQWHTGSGAPASSLGEDGDYYLDTDLPNDFYVKEAGAWAVQGQLRGDAVFLSGSGAPDGGTGNVGDYYLDTIAPYTLHQKTGPSAWTEVAELQGPIGPQGDQGDPGPQGPQGVQGATGPQGATGAQGPQGATGAQGPQGPTGATGPQGATGAQGPQGATGATGPQGPAGDAADWLSGAGLPASGLGTVGDWYLRTDGGNVYEKTGSSTWTFRTNLLGPQGIQGPQGPAGPQGATGATGATGAAGSKWYTGSTIPAGGTGVVGDFYLRSTDGTYYEKIGASTWTARGSILGPQGATGPAGATGATGPQGDPGPAGPQGPAGDNVAWLNGVGEPAPGTGEVGDWYIDTDTGLAYEKTASDAWTLRLSIIGPPGAEGPQGPEGDPGPQGIQGIEGPPGPAGQAADWSAGTGAPAGVTGEVGDWYLDTTTGDVYEKTGTLVWTLRANIRGEVGPEGPEGPPGGMTDAFRPEDYGALSAPGSVVDDSAAIQAAIDAADAVDGGKVVLKRGVRYGATGVIVVKNGVHLVGNTTMKPATTPLDTVPGIVALDDTFVLRIGQWSTGNDAPGGVSNLTVDGDGIAGGSTEAEALVIVEGVSLHINALHTLRSSGNGIKFNATQNSEIIGLRVDHNGLAGVRVDNGCGALQFLGGHLSNNSTHALVIGDPVAEDNAYPFGSVQITFFGTIFERYDVADTSTWGALVHVKAGQHNVFYNCAFSSPEAAIDDDCILLIDNTDGIGAGVIASMVVLSNPFFYGGPGASGNQTDAIRIVGTQFLKVEGEMLVQGVSHAICQDTGTARVDLQAEIIALSAQPTRPNFFRSINGGSRSQWFGYRETGIRYRLDAGDGVYFRGASDTNNRSAIASNGAWIWYDGVSGTPRSILNPSTDGLKLTLNTWLERFGRDTHTAQQVNVTVVGQDVSLDSAQYSRFLLVFVNNCTIDDFGITNPQVGTEIRIGFITAGTNTVAAYASDIVWANGTPPDLTKPFFWVTLRYVGGGVSKWQEVSRSHPAGGGGGGGGGITSVNGDAGPVVSLDAADVGAAPASHTHTKSEITDYDEYDLPSQAEAEAGVATTERVWSAERVKQAIEALSGTGSITSVNGDTGPAVTLDAADVGAATAAQGALADTAVQPGDLATVATTGAYSDLTGKPTIPDDPGDIGAQPADADLTTIAGLTPTDNDLIQRKAGAWTNRTPAQVKADLAIAAGDVSGLSAVATSGSASDITTGTLPTSVLPPLAINETTVVADQAAMLALTAQRGDVAIRTDNGKTYILSSDSPGTLADWKEILATGQVQSVNGETGVVVIDYADVGAAPTSHTHAQSDITGLTTALGNKQDADGDLTTIASLTPTDDDFMQRKSGGWANRTVAQVKTDLALPADTVTALAGKQPLDNDLTAIGGLTSAANKLPYATGSETWAMTDFTAFARTLLDDADAATARATLGISDSLRMFEVTTATAAATAAKTATLGSYAYTDGDLITVVATNGNVAASPTLNIDGLGAKNIFLGGSALTIYSGVLVANGRWTMRYDSATDRFDLLGMSGNYDIISQATMEAGTSTTVGYMNPALVAAAIRYIMGIRSPNAQTGTNYTLVLGDAERTIDHSNAAASTITIPTNTSVAFPIGTTVSVFQRGAGQVSFVPVDGTVTVRNSSSAAARAQWSVISAKKIGTNEWLVFGDVQ